MKKPILFIIALLMISWCHGQSGAGSGKELNLVGRDVGARSICATDSASGTTVWFAGTSELITPERALYSHQRKSIKDEPGLLSRQRVEELLRKPDRLKGYRTRQSGYLTKIDTVRGNYTDTTYTVENIKIDSDGLKINGWLYLPLGEGRFPLIVLTNGGGDGSMAIRSLSDFMAPILAHCGVAAFVHDKRGTGESEGIYKNTTYNDYATDAGNCAVFLSKHRRINPDLIGVMGGSEGGRIAILTASRFEAVSFAILFAGPVVNSIDDRNYAQTCNLRRANIPDSVFSTVLNMHEKSIRAWGSGSVDEIARVDREIIRMREQGWRYLPATKAEFDSVRQLEVLRPSWYSLACDYTTELKHFRKKLLAMYGEVDQVVSVNENVRALTQYMELSNNRDYSIIRLPNCGHSPVDTETKELIRIDNIALNWINDNVTKIFSSKQ